MNRKATSRYMSDDEAETIRLLLGHGGQPWEIKQALKRLCRHYETNLRLRDPTIVATILRGLLWSSDASTRKWVYKTLGLIGSEDDRAAIIARIKTESDSANHPWGLAATVRLSRSKGLQEIVSDIGIDKTAPMFLAARLYGETRQLDDIPELTLEPDRTVAHTLWWAVLLAGYNKAPSNIFGTRHQNEDVLRALFGHDDEAVAECSIWATWHRSDLNPQRLPVELDTLRRRSCGVRRWTYRLLTKPSCRLLEADVLQDVIKDECADAREALALGLADERSPKFPEHILDWHDVERDARIKVVLLELMASRSDDHSEYGHLVIDAFEAARNDASMRQRLLAAAAQTPLYAHLRKLDVEQRARDLGNLSLFGEKGTTVMVEKNQGTVIIAGNDLKMRDFSGNRVEQSNLKMGDDTKILSRNGLSLQEVLSVIDHTQNLSLEDKNKIKTAAEAYNQKQNETTKRALLDVVKSVGAVAGSVTGVSKLMEIVERWAA